MMPSPTQKINWRGKVHSIQVRATVWRYLIDNRTHSEIGYNLFLDGEADGELGRFSVAISEKQQEKCGFRIGCEASGTAWTKMYSVTDYADYYRAGALKALPAAERNDASAPPPWKIAPPPLETYHWRGARQLASSRWKTKCFQCAWANMAAVQIEYNWGVSRKYRFESFCYGPISCKFYSMGKARAVPYIRNGSSYDYGCLDEICVQNRHDDDE